MRRSRKMEQAEKEQYESLIQNAKQITLWEWICSGESVDAKQRHSPTHDGGLSKKM